MTDYCLFFRGLDWTFIKSDPDRGLLDELLNIYPFLDHDYLKFVASFEICQNSEETKWFLGSKDFFKKASEDSPFTIDTFMNISLDASETKEEKDKVISFWRNNCPIMISVEGSYTLYFIAKNGSIFKSWEPEFENPVLVCNSFKCFLENKLFI